MFFRIKLNYFGFVHPNCLFVTFLREFLISFKRKSLILLKSSLYSSILRILFFYFDKFSTILSTDTVLFCFTKEWNKKQTKEKILIS